MTRDINPEAFTRPIDPAEFSNTDTTFDIPGYADPARLKKQQEEFPEHDFWAGKTVQPINPEDQQGEGIDQPTTDQQGTDQQNVLPQDTTTTDTKPVRAQLDYKIPINEFGKHDVRYLFHRNGQPYSDQMIEAFKLEFPLLDLENQVTELLDDELNLDKQAQAFNLIRSNQDLVDRLDRNGDGQYTFADMYYTSRWNGGKGITAEQDAKYTQEWINGVNNKSFGRRIKQLMQSDRLDYQGLPNPLLGGMPYMLALLKNRNASRVVLDRRRKALASLSELPPGSNLADAGAKGWTEWVSTLLSYPEQLGSFATGGDFGSYDAKLDDWLLKHKDPSSYGFALWNPSYRQGADGTMQELAYWGPEALLATLTLGAGSGKLLKHTKHLPKAQRLAGLWTSNLLKPEIFQTKNIFTGAKTQHFLGNTFLKRFPMTAKKLAPIQKTINFGGSTYKTALLETLRGTMMRDISKNNLIELVSSNPETAWIVKNFPESEGFGQSMSAGIYDTSAKRLAYLVSEANQDTIGAFMLWGFFQPIMPTTRFLWNRTGLKDFTKTTLATFSQIDLDKFKNSTNKWNWNTWIGRDPLNEEKLFDIRNQINNDIAEAGKKQLSKDIEGADNPYFKDGQSAQNNSNYSAYANGPHIEGQGIAPVRGTVTEILNDSDELTYQIIPQNGTTDSLFSPLNIRKGARDGISNETRLKLGIEYLQDPKRRRQLAVIDKNSRNLKNYNEGTLRRIQDLESRDAGALTVDEYWPEELILKEFSLEEFKEFDALQTFLVDKLEVQDAINQSIFLRTRDQAGAALELAAKNDIFVTDGPMSRLTDNLTIGLTEVKKTRFATKLIKQTLNNNNNKITASMVEDLNKQIDLQGKYFHEESVEAVRLMNELFKNSEDTELASSFLEFFRMSSDLHNWTDINAFIHRQFFGGRLNDVTQVGALQQEMKGVMLNSVLSGPKTPLRALTGTAINTWYNAVTEAAGSFIIAGFGGDVLSRQISAAKLASMMQMIPNAYKIFNLNLKSKFKADFSELKTRYNNPYDKNELDWEFGSQLIERDGTKAEQSALGLFNIARNLNNNAFAGWSTRSLSAIDPTFKWILANTRSLELAFREVAEEAGGHIGKLKPEELAKVQDKHYKNLLDIDGNIDVGRDSFLKKQYEEVTLTTEMTGVAKDIQELVKHYPLLEPFYFFARTGINGLNFSYKNTPLLSFLHSEAIDILSHKGTDFTKLAKYGIENAEDLITAKKIFAGRQAIGMGVVATMAFLYQSGNLTGNGPANRQMKEAWKTGGWKENTITLGNVSFNYSALEPFNVILSAIANIGDNIELMGSEWAEKRLQAVAFVVGRGITGKSYLSGLDQLMQIAQNPFSHQSSKAVMNVFNNSLPLAGMRNEFGKWINPHMKELNSSMWDSVRNRNQWLEGVAQKPLPVKHDILNGKPINNWNIFGRSFNAISPVQIDIRSQSDGRKFLLESNYDLKTSLYSHNGYSLVKENHIRSNMQNLMGNSPVRVRGKIFKNPEEALSWLYKQQDIQKSLQEMKRNVWNPEKMFVDPKDYPHNQAIKKVFDQARSYAWIQMNKPTHPMYPEIQRIIGEKDGHDNITRETRKDILELGFPQQFPE